MTISSFVAHYLFLSDNKTVFPVKFQRPGECGGKSEAQHAFKPAVINLSHTEVVLKPDPTMSIILHKVEDRRTAGHLQMPSVTICLNQIV